MMMMAHRLWDPDTTPDPTPSPGPRGPSPTPRPPPPPPTPPTLRSAGRRDHHLVSDGGRPRQLHPLAALDPAGDMTPSLSPSTPHPAPRTTRRCHPPSPATGPPLSCSPPLRSPAHLRSLCSLAALDPAAGAHRAHRRGRRRLLRRQLPGGALEIKGERGHHGTGLGAGAGAGAGCRQGRRRGDRAGHCRGRPSGRARGLKRAFRTVVRCPLLKYLLSIYK